MKKYLAEFRVENRPDRLKKILFNWKLWVLGSIVGALIGAGIYAIFPPKYRAVAKVVVDQNIEQAFHYFEDRELFTFMHRETEKLKAVAWSDEVLIKVADSFNGIDLEYLNSGNIHLTPAQDGVWSFYVDYDDGRIIKYIASVWASEFVKSVRTGVEVSLELEIARDALEDFLADNPDADLRDINPYLDVIRELQESVKGISQYIDVTHIPGRSFPVERSAGLGTYIILSAIILDLLLVLVILFLPQKNKEKNA